MARARYIANEFSVATAIVPFGAEFATTTDKFRATIAGITARLERGRGGAT
jgi:hypothetical protein